MLARSAPAACFLVSLAMAGCKCSSSGTLSSSAASSAGPLSELAASVSAMVQAKRKTVAELVAPPLTPPDDAQSGPEGLRYKIVKLGVGQPLGESDGLQAEYSIWTQTGSLAYSTYQGRGPAGATAAVVPPALFSVASKLPPGSRALLWLPAPLVQRLRTQHANLPLPDTALVIEYEPVEVLHRAPPEPENSLATNPGNTGALEQGRAALANAFPAPDAAGPPKGALSSASGLRYIVLSSGAGGTKPKPDDKLSLSLTLWPVAGLVVDAPLFVKKPSATTLTRAPAGLAQVLQTLTPGSSVRVWLPIGKAQQVGPVPPGRDAVLDLTLEQIE